MASHPSGREDRRPRPGRILAAVLCLTGLISIPAAAGLDPGSVWPMFHRGATHGGRVWIATPSSPNVAWSAALSDTVEFSSPALDRNGVIYLGDQGKELWAFNASGYRLWNYHTMGNIRYSSPAIGADSTIYIGSADNKLYAIRANGTLKWASPTNGPVKTAPAIAPDGTVYVGSDDGRLWAFNPDGTPRWSFVTGDTVRSSPAIGADGTVYFGSNDGLIYAVYPNGTLRWAGATGGPIKGGPAIGRDGEIIVGSSDGYLYSIDPAGNLNWATFTGQNIRSTPAIGVYGRIYLSMDTMVYAFHNTGEPSWHYDTGSRVYSSPAVYTRSDSSDIVFCGSDDGKLYAVTYGSLIWAAPLGSSPVRSSPAIGPRGNVYVGTMAGRLYSIGTNDPTAVEPARTDGLAAGPRLDLFPNPLAEGSVRIRLAAGPAGGPGVLHVYDPGGREVFSRSLDARAEAVWDGHDREGRRLPSGVYLVQWRAGGHEARARLVRVR